MGENRAMSSSMRLVAALVVVIAAAGVYLAAGSSEDQTTGGTRAQAAATPAATPTATPVAADDAAPEAQVPEPAEASTPGRYVAYSADALASATGTRLIFFHAPWCTQCRELERTIEADGLPDDVTVLKADYDSNQALRRKYGVTLQTTVVKVDADGEKLESFVPYDDPQIGRVLDELT